MKARQTGGVAVAAAKASFSTATAYLLEGAGRVVPSSKVRERRRPDPLVDIFDAEVVPMLKAAPGLRAVGIFEELSAQRRRCAITTCGRRLACSSRRSPIPRMRGPSLRLPGTRRVTVMAWSSRSGL